MTDDRSQAVRPFANLPGGLRPLGYRDYLLFWIGFVVSNTGRWIEMTGSLWLVSELTDAPVALAGLGVARAVPAILLSPVAGVIADRVDQRRLLFITQAASLTLSVALAVSIAAGAVELWQVYLQLAIQSCVQPFDLAARQTLFPRLVPRSDLPEAVTLTVVAARVAKFVGPAIGGLVIATMGEAVPYVLNALSFLVLMVAVVAMRPAPNPIVASTTSFAMELRDGFSEIRRTPVIYTVFKLEAVFVFLQENDVLITIVALQVLGLGAEGLGLLLAAPAFGAVAGLVALVALGQGQRPGRAAVVCIGAYGAMMILVAVTTAPGVVFVALAISGLLDSWVTVVRHSIVQLTAPSRMRGRINANMAVLSTGVSPLSQVQSGVLIGLIGATPAIIGAAAAMVAITGAIATRNRALWNFTMAGVRETVRTGPASPRPASEGRPPPDEARGDPERA